AQAINHDTTITITRAASRPSSNPLRAASRSAAPRTTIQARLERLIAPYAIYQDDLEENDDREVAERYNTLSPSYDELYEQEQSPKHKAVIEFIADERFKILVDVGCGPGTFLERAQELYEYAIGIDLSMSMLNAAKRRRTGKTDLVQATSRLLPIKNDSVNCLVSISTLRADPSLRASTSEMKRICRKKTLLADNLLQH